MNDIKRRKQEAIKAWDPIDAELDIVYKKEKEQRKLQRKCYWTWPWGHVANTAKDEWGGPHCAVCNKWLR